MISYIVSLLTIVVSISLHAREIFDQFPALTDKLPHVALCDLPTPITKLEQFGAHIGCNQLYIKRDDLTGKRTPDNQHLYGGNKPRKLEFLLADAMTNYDATTIITYGCAGSNHALATATYAHELGLSALLMLKDQPNSYVIRHNLLLDAYYNAQLQFYPNNKERNSAADKLLAENPRFYRIPTGGSNSIGAIGFVNAGLELAAQIKAGTMPAPDYIYVATGSCATTAGLLLGLMAAGLDSKVVAVCIEPEEFPDEFSINITKLFKETNEKLHAIDASFPLFDFPSNNLILNKKFCGTAYGLFIPETTVPMKLFKETEHITLEGTYSAKPIAAIMDDAATGLLAGKIVLFWDTYCGIDFSYLTKDIDYKTLPEQFQRYFEEDVQPLAKA